MNYTKFSDAELLTFLKEGDHVAFHEIYKRYGKILLDSAFRRLNSIEESEELVQELFINLYIRRAEININSNLEAFLKTALKYRVFNFFRHKMTRETYAALVSNENRFEEEDPQQQLEVKELASKIKIATEKLPRRCREVFILSKIENMSNKSIAEKLGISVSAVEQHITKAIKLMKDDFKFYDQGFIIVLLLFCFK